MKTRKSIKKRFKFTKQGKVMRRAIGQDHFLAKNSPKKRRQLRKWVRLSPVEEKRIKKLVSH